MATRYLPSGPGILATSKPFQFVDATASINFARELLTGDGIPVEELDSYRLSYEEFSLETANELGVFFGESEVSTLRRFVVYEYMRYKDVIDNNSNAVVRWGSSARCILNIKKTDINISLNGIAGISAATKINALNNSVNIEGIGFNPGPLSNALPKFSQLDMTTYVILEQAFREALPILMEDQNNLQPTLLGVFGEAIDPVIEDESLRFASARVYALTEIAKRFPLKKSGYFNSRKAEEGFKKVAEAAFLDFTGYDSIDKRPSKELSGKAERILKGIEMEYKD